MAIEVKKREGETPNSFVYRFNKRIQRSGLVKEVRERQFTKRAPNRRSLKLSAVYRLEKQKDQELSKKLGQKTSF